MHLEFSPEVFLHFTTQQLVGDDDEVYEATGGPGSIRDIWKKFELSTLTPPTPPLSPSRQTTGAASPTYFTSAAADTLQCVSDILDLDSCRTMFAEHSCANLTSKLIQDCMWGSHSLQEKVQRVKRIESVYDTPCSTPPSFYALDYVSAECVDPASVFPYHINNQDFPSGESSSEDEIDVVTIEKPVKRKCPPLPCNNNNINMSKTLEQNDQPAAKRPKMNPKRSRENANKEIKECSVETDQDPSNRVSGKEKFEDPECKRNVHNVLERKRRNDLKYSFQVLRDSIPDLKGSERAPKVAILRKATDCILNLRSEQERLLEKKSLLERTHQSLKQRLKVLKESS